MLKRMKLSVATIAMASMILASSGSATVFADTKTATTETADTSKSDETSKYDNKAVATVRSNSTLNIRKSASKDADIVGKMKKGNIATVVKKGDSWTKIKSGSVKGYVNNDYLVFDSDIESYAADNIKQTATVEVETLRVREAANLDSEIVTLVDKDDKLKVKNTKKDGWVKVKTNDGSGYVREDYVDVN